MLKDEKNMLDFAISILCDEMGNDVDLAKKIGRSYQSLIRLQQKALEREMLAKGELQIIVCPYCLKNINLYKDVTYDNS
jgi:hypothetical protein